jgi:hypothetical protein
MQPCCIVIDERQNVAERARNAQKSQRAKFAELLSTRSEILILLLARPALHLRIVTKIKSIGKTGYNAVLSIYRPHSALQGRTSLEVLQ